jgi:HlyD family secretion protein
MSTLLCSLPLIATLLADCAPKPPLATGYVEGEFILIAPVATARIDSVTVKRGDQAEAGALLVQLERRDAEIALAAAKAALARAESELENLTVGMRQEEIGVIEAALASAEAKAAEAERERDRMQSLFLRGVVPEAQIDAASTTLNVARAAVAEARAQLSVARLPARPQQIAAASAAVEQARESVRAAEWQLDQRALVAPAAGHVDEILRSSGEIAGPQAPALAFLPDGAVKLKLYVPEAAIAGITPGTTFDVHCDGCPPGTSAIVTYVSHDPEFTPPVIYSLVNRQKLVYLVEATPAPGSTILKPGQIVDVDLGDPAE